MRQRAPVRLDRGKIDGQRAAGLRRRTLGGYFDNRFGESHAVVIALGAAAVKPRNSAVCVVIQIAEPRDRSLELQFHSACGAVTLFTDDHFGLAVDPLALRQPFGEFLAVRDSMGLRIW